MPLFEFNCDGCGAQFEEIVSRDSVVSCPKCGDANVRKLFSAFAVRSGGGSSSRSIRPSAAPSPG